MKTEAEVRKILLEHRQKYENSCFSSAIEIVLKLTGKISEDATSIQDMFNESIDFENDEQRNYFIKNYKICFHKSFGRETIGNFSFPRLESKINEQIDFNNFVILSLPSKYGTVDDQCNYYHAHVFFNHGLKDAEYQSVTYASPHIQADGHKLYAPIEIRNWVYGELENVLKGYNDGMEGCDLIWYTKIK